jgi:ribonuclease HI
MEDKDLPRGVATLGGASVVVHFDGACQPPKGPGIATFGLTVEGEGLYFEEHGLATTPYSEHSTNNVAEYVAAIRALEWLRSQSYRGAVTVVGDSQLIVRQMTGEYEVKTEHLRAYHDRLAQLASEFGSVEWQWVPREENRRADALSKLAIEEARPAARRLRDRSPVGEKGVRDVLDPGAERESP